jgi:hypothetical protein
MNILSSRGGECATYRGTLNGKDASSRSFRFNPQRRRLFPRDERSAVHYLLDITDHRISRILAKRRRLFVVENLDGRSRTAKKARERTQRRRKVFRDDSSRTKRMLLRPSIPGSFLSLSSSLRLYYCGMAGDKNPRNLAKLRESHQKLSRERE